MPRCTRVVCSCFPGPRRQTQVKADGHWGRRATACGFPTPPEEGCDLKLPVGRWGLSKAAGGSLVYSSVKYTRKENYP